MSLDQAMRLPNGYGFDAVVAVDPPTVFTLVLDDLLSRWHVAAQQQFKVTATAGTTGFIPLDDELAINSATAMAGLMQNELEALSGYSGKVTVSGAETNAGDTYTFTITFDASLVAVTLDFHASSQWYPAITLTEAVTQQGIADVVGVYEVSSIQAVPVEMGVTGDTTTDSNGNSVTCDENGIKIAHNSASGWSTAGGTNNPLEFVCDAYGPQGTAKQSGNGSVTRTVLGVTPVTGQPEIHTITPTPVNPTGGTWKPKGSGSNIGYAAIATDIRDAIGLDFDGAQVSVDAPLSSGTVTVTGTVNTTVSDTVLSPVNTSLTAPEITHSIT